ncbi:ankyrin repeat domain-containing protein [Peptostreptococcus porci]|uniref:ankyrin repeat domain-containing protein n=1 Tax=Peptostreptococcus porci TaxID=2652282 RepID=UPI002A90CDE4|nr:ankyrin repeat domain-containing protein [Peptostreptococcus porci]MDY5437035.1 ankyrin repeat domain-containing protein [Peptostreptococcus porci]
MSVFKYEKEDNSRIKPEEFFYGKNLNMAKAIYLNDINKVEKLLKEGVDINEVSEENTMTYLFYSVMLDNRFEIAELLLKHNADPNKVSKALSNSKKYEFYYLPLSYASANKSIKYITLLLKYGADPNKIYKNKEGRIELDAMPAINSAVRSAYILDKWDRKDFMNDIKARIELLLKYGADINSIGSMGKTVVEWANSNPEIVLYLMDKGADHRLYGTKMLKRVKNTLRANPDDEHAKEIIRRLTELGYE